MWPLVGREAELQQVEELIRAGRKAIVLAGPAGVGKTRLASECLGVAANQGFVPVRVAATQGAAGLPFGAFAALVPDMAASADRLQVLHQIARAVRARGEGSPVAVFVDDAHLLDESSGALTLLLAGTPGTCVLATLRSGEPACDPVVALWKDGLAERLELRPLGEGHVAELLAGALGGPVDGATVRMLHDRTQGNALFLRELVLGALEAGVLRVEEGNWRLVGELPTSPRLVEIIESRLRHLDDRARRGLDLLAVGEPLEVEFLTTVDPHLDLEGLEHRGIVQITGDGRRFGARLSHPLYGEAVRARMSPLRGRASARTLADALRSTGARRREDTLRLATWSLDGGGAFEPSMMLAAATTARAHCDFRLAERLATAAFDAGAGFEAGLLIGQLLWLQRRAAEAEDHFGSLLPMARSDAQRARLAAERLTNLYWGLRQADAALRVAEEAAASIKDVAYRDEVEIERARLLGRTGSYAAAVALVEPLIERASGTALVSACIGAGTYMVITGQIAAAIAASERGLAAHLELTGAPLPFGPYIHPMIGCVGLIAAGRLAEAAAIAGPHYEQAIRDGSVEARAFWAIALARHAMIGGQAASAARVAGEAAGAFRDVGWPPWIRVALLLRANALALLGEPEAARSVLAEIDALDMPPGEFWGPELLRARAWVAVAGGDMGGARSHLDEAAAMARRGGGGWLEGAALHDLARLGEAARVAERLSELTAIVEGPLAATWAAHAAALARHDAGALEAAEAAFGQCGALILAAEAAADAAVAWRREGRPRVATAAERRSAAWAARCEGARTPSLATAGPVRAALTPRELEIARLAAAGLANKEIAERLFLSHRTVENKLHTAYEKLGVDGRADLARALEGS